MIKHLLIFLTLCLLAGLPLRAQSSIELPKPDTGALGIHFKLMQSIPYEAYTHSRPRLYQNDKTIVVPVGRFYDTGGGDRAGGNDFDMYSLVSGNAGGSLGFVTWVWDSVTSPDFSVAVGCSMKKINATTFFRLGGGGTLKPAYVREIKNKNCSIGRGSVLSQNGEYLAAADPNGALPHNIEIWDSRAAELLTTIVSTDNITHLSFSQDAKMLAASEADGSVQVWAVPSGQPIRTFDMGHSAEWTDFVPGRTSIVAVGGGEVFVWDLNSGQRLDYFRLDVMPSDVGAAGLNTQALTPDGRLLISAGGLYRPAQAYDLQSGAKVAEFDSAEGSMGSGRDVSVSRDGTMVTLSTEAPGLHNYIVRIWRIERE
jgi:WD40 repeat protein